MKAYLRVYTSVGTFESVEEEHSRESIVHIARIAENSSNVDTSMRIMTKNSALFFPPVILQTSVIEIVIDGEPVEFAKIAGWRTPDA